MAAPFWIYKKAYLWHFFEPSSVYTKVRACLKKTYGEVIFHPCRCLYSISSILFLHPQTGDPA